MDFELIILSSNQSQTKFNLDLPQIKFNSNVMYTLNCKQFRYPISITVLLGWIVSN